MKVIAEGRTQKGWAKEYSCTGAGNGNGGCGAVLLVEIGDVFQTERHCRDETDYYTTFRCSQCGVLTDINDAPSHVQQAARVQRGLWRDPNWKPEEK